MNNISKATVIAAVAIMVAVFAVPMLSGDTDAMTGTWDGTTDTSWYDEASEETSYDITTAEQLAGLAKLVNEGNSFKNTTFTLTTDISLSGHAWTPIGFSGRVDPGESLESIKKFEGTFDGKGNSVIGLTSEGYTVSSGDNRLNDEDTFTYGLFGFVNDATIQNIVFEDIDIDLGTDGTTKCDSAGAVAGHALGTTSISGITVKMGTIASTDATGGVLGRYYGNEILTISNCSNSADITSSASGGKSGGIIGTVAYATSVTISGCSSSREITGDYAGGIVGMFNSNVTGCSQTVSGCNVSESTISGLNHAGGLIGRGCIGVTLSDSSVSNSAISTVSDDGKSDGYAGGLMGGQTGSTSTIAVTDCSVSRCNIKAEVAAGGFIGKTIGPVVSVSGGSITNLTAEAISETDVVGRTHAGGIIGAVEPGTTIEVSISDVKFAGTMSLESSTEDCVYASAYCGTLEGSAIGYLAGTGAFSFSNLDDYADYELIAEARVFSDTAVTTTITFSGCNTKNVMEWAIDSTAPELTLNDSILAGLILDYGGIEIEMDENSSIGQLIAGADDETAKKIDELVYKDEVEQKWISAKFIVKSGQTVTVDNAVAMDEHNLVPNPSDSNQLLRKYYGEIVGEDSNSSLIVREGTTGLAKGTYVWDANAGEWVSAIASVGGTLYGSLESALDAAKDNDTVTLLDDTTISKTITISKKITIDLNRCTVTSSVTGENMIVVDTGGDLTIMDGSADGSEATGTIHDETTDKTILAKTGSSLTIESGNLYRKADTGAVIEASGTLIIDGGHITFESGLDNANGYAIRVTYGADATINNVEIDSQKAGILVRAYEGDTSSTTLVVKDADISSYYYAFAVWGYGYTEEDDMNNAVLTVENADVVVSNPNQTDNSELAAFGTTASSGDCAGHTINIQGGTYKANTGGYFPSYGIYNISGGTFDCSMYGFRVSAGEVNISGTTQVNVDAADDNALLVPSDGKTDRPTGIKGPLTIGKQNTGYPGDIEVNITGGSLNNSQGNAVTVYDDNMGATDYSANAIQVNFTSGTVKGNVEYIHTEADTSNPDKLAFTLDGGTVDGNIEASDELVSKIDIKSGAVSGTVPDTTTEATGTVKFPGNDEPIDFYESFTMPAAPAEKPGYTFKGYSLTEDGSVLYKPGDTVSGQTGTVTVYEIWEEVDFSVDFGFDEMTYYFEEGGTNQLENLAVATGGATVTIEVEGDGCTVGTDGTITISSSGTFIVTATATLGDRYLTDSFTLIVVQSPNVDGISFSAVTDTMEKAVRATSVPSVPVESFIGIKVFDIEADGAYNDAPIPYSSLGWNIDASNYDDYVYYAIHYTSNGETYTPDVVTVTGTEQGIVVDFREFSPYMFGYASKSVNPDPEPTPGGDDEPVSPPSGDDDGPLPPVIRPESSSSSSDDDTVTIVACAAAAVVAALMAVFLIVLYRKD